MSGYEPTSSLSCRPKTGRTILVLGLSVVLISCEDSKLSEVEQKQCFDTYIEEHRAQYPVETLKKTAALKCYSS